ncbi:MAG: NAD(P)H-dependent flavin oxidoreductase, partial [Thermoleophilaceae bacterium]
MLRTRATELLGIEHPILQAPMASAATPALAAAVSEAGGLGALGSAILDPDELRRQTAELRAGTQRPFQLNFFCHPRPRIAPEEAAAARERLAPLYGELGLGEPPQPSVPPIDFGDDALAALLELRPPVVSFHFGLPEPDAVAAIRAAGMRVLASATTVAEATWLEERGVDAVVA